MTQTAVLQRGSEQTSDQNAIRPIQMDIPEPELTELRRRINATNWPERQTVTDASQGVQFATIQALARYWAPDYDWRMIEAKMNTLPQFITEIDGPDIHFIHVRSKRKLLSGRDRSVPAQLGGAGVSQTDPLQQAPQGRSLCGLGTAEALF